MARLPALCAIRMPIEQVYKCVLPTDTALWVIWGTENRDCPVRKIGPGYWKLRAIDGTANMYWTLATYLASGFLGISMGMALTMQECRGFLPRMSDKEREDLGIRKPLPRSISESLRSCKAERDTLGSMLEHEILDFYFLAKREEMKQFANMTPAQQIIFYLEQF